MDKTYNELKDFYDQYDDNIWGLENKLEKLQDEYEDLEDELDSLKKSHDKLKDEHDGLVESYDELEQNYDKYSQIEGLDVQGLNDNLKLTILIKAFQQYSVDELEKRLDLNFVHKF